MNNYNDNDGGPPSKRIRVEPGEKVKHRCKICGSGFGVKWKMDRHVKTVHDRKKVKCNECDQEFNRSEHLQRHVSAVHEVMEYECSECEYVCSRKDNLLRHKQGSHGIVKMKRKAEININNGNEKRQKIENNNTEEIFQCEQCEQTFGLKKNLVKHINTVHGNIKYKCDKCHLEFNRKDSLIRHLPVHENMKGEKEKCLKEKQKGEKEKKVKEKPKQKFITVIDKDMEIDETERTAFKNMLIEKQWMLRGEKDILEMFKKFKSKLIHRMGLVLDQQQYRMNITILTKMIREDKEGGIEEVNHYFNGGARFIPRDDRFGDEYNDSVKSMEKQFEEYLSNG